jgi:hypothetical protein
MGKGGGGSQTQVVKNDPPAYLQPYLKSALSEAESLYKAGPTPIYPNQMYAPMNEIQRQSLDRTLKMANTGNPLVSAAQNSMQNMLETPAGQNPYLDQLLQQYGQKANALVASNFNQAGRMGSGAHAGTAAREISRETLPLLFDQYNKDQQMKLAAGAMAPQLAQFDYDQMARAGSVGDVYQEYDQMKLQEDMARYNYEHGGAESAHLDEYLNRIYANPSSQFGTETGTGSKSVGTGGKISSVLGGLGTLGGIGSGLSSFLGGGSALASTLGGSAGTLGTIASVLGIFSDRRLKENIERVGEQNGFNLYEFSYKGSPNRRFIGVMADEVEKIKPEAVRMIGNYKSVDYNKIGIEMKEVFSGGGSFPPFEAKAAPLDASRWGTVESTGGVRQGNTVAYNGGV